MLRKSWEIVLEYIAFIADGNEAFCEDFDPNNICLAPGILWGSFCILIKLFEQGAAMQNDLPELIGELEKLKEKHPKIMNRSPRCDDVIAKLKAIG